MKPFQIIFIFSFIVAIFYIGGFLLKSKLIKSENAKVPTQSSSQKIISSPSERDLIIKENELNNSLPQEIQKVLEEPSVKVLPEYIQIEGKATKLFGQKITIKLIPEVVDEKLDLKVTEAKVGIINAPKSLIEKIISPFEDKMIENQKNVIIKSIRLENKQIIITGI